MPAHSLRARFKETVTEAILTAAEELASEVGVQGASLQEIAQRAGIAVGTIYNHFADRDELFLTLFARRRDGLLAHLDAESKKSSRASFDEQLGSFVRAVFTHFDELRPFLKLALGGQLPKPRAKPGTRQAATLEDLTVRAARIVKVGVKEKRLKTENADLFPAFLVAAIRAVLVTRIDLPKPFVGETDRVVSLFLNGAAR